MRNNLFPLFIVLLAFLASCQNNMRGYTEESLINGQEILAQIHVDTVEGFVDRDYPEQALTVPIWTDPCTTILVSGINDRYDNKKPVIAEKKCQEIDISKYNAGFALIRIEKAKKVEWKSVPALLLKNELPHRNPERNFLNTVVYTETWATPIKILIQLE